MSEQTPKATTSDESLRPAELDPSHPHKPADDREEIYYEGSPMLRAEILKLGGWALVAGVLIAGAVLLFMYRPWESSRVYLWAALAMIAAAIVVAVVPILIIRATRYRIGNYRIDYEHGLISRSVDTLELWHVDDIKLHQSLIERILNVGTVSVMSHDDTTPNLQMRGLPNPRPLFETLKQRVIAVKRQRGVIKMDIG